MTERQIESRQNDKFTLRAFTVHEQKTHNETIAKTLLKLQVFKYYIKTGTRNIIKLSKLVFKKQKN